MRADAALISALERSNIHPLWDRYQRIRLDVAPAPVHRASLARGASGAFTVLEPADRAVPHRHTAAAIRFSTRAEGAVTIVNGRLMHKTIGTVLQNRADAYVQNCKMK